MAIWDDDDLLFGEKSPHTPPADAPGDVLTDEPLRMVPDPSEAPDALGEAPRAFSSTGWFQSALGLLVSVLFLLVLAIGYQWLENRDRTHHEQRRVDAIADQVSKRLEKLSRTVQPPTAPLTPPTTPTAGDKPEE